MFTIKEQMFEGGSIPSELESMHWDLSILGEKTLDQRCLTACNFSEGRSKNFLRLSYCADQRSLLINNVKCNYGSFKEKLRDCNNLLVEATSLHCPEIMNILRCALELKVKKISFLYLEPIQYRKSIEGTLSESRSFDLSRNSRFLSNSVQYFPD